MNSRIAVFSFVLCCLVLPLQTARADLNSDAETIFNWAEASFPDILSPATQTLFIEGWRYRFYTNTQTYLAVNDSQEVAVYGDLFGGLLVVGTVAEVLPLTGQSTAGTGFGQGSSWTFAWNSSTTTFAQGSGSSGSTDQGQFTLTLGAPITAQGQTAYPVTVTGEPGDFAPRWQYLVQTSDGSLLGSVTGADLVTVFSRQGSWQGGGFFAQFDTDDDITVTSGTFDGQFNDVSADIARRSSSDGGCEQILGMTLCSDSSTSFSESDYFKDGIGPIGYQQTASYSSSGGGFFTSTSISKTVELVSTTFAASDGTVFELPPWETLPAMSVPRDDPVVAVLNGELYVMGGYNGDFFETSMEIYDPGTDSWRLGATLPGTVFGGAEAVDGKIYVSDGDDIFIYDPGTESWSIGNLASTANAGLGDDTATGFLPALGNFVVGIGGGSTVSRQLDVKGYSPTLNSWLVGVNLSVSEWLRPSVEAIGNTVYVIGGFGAFGFSDRGALRDVATYNVETDEWSRTAVAEMITARDNLTTATLDGKIYAIGGNGVGCGFSSCTQTVPLRSVEVYDPQSNSWMEIISMNTARKNAAAAVLDGKIYVVGGRSGSGSSTILNTVERYSP